MHAMMRKCMLISTCRADAQDKSSSGRVSFCKVLLFFLLGQLLAESMILFNFFGSFGIAKLQNIKLRSFSFIHR